jgi:hypothetical protein
MACRIVRAVATPLLPLTGGLVNRRHFLAAAGATALHLGSRAFFSNAAVAAQSIAKADSTLRIAPVSVERKPFVKPLSFSCCRVRMAT